MSSVMQAFLKELVDTITNFKHVLVEVQPESTNQVYFSIPQGKAYMSLL
jgi:hypothetical protein